MTCDEVRDLLELYALGVLEEDEQIEVATHLATDCRHCNADLRNAIRLNSAVLMTAAEKAISPALRKRVLAAVKPSSSMFGTVGNWIWAGLAAAALATAMWNVQQKSEQIASLQNSVRESTGEAARLNAAFAFLKDPQTRPADATGTAAQPRGTYFISPRGVLLIASNLPVVRPGQTYEMWVIPKGAAPRPAGLFRPDTAGTAVHFIEQTVDIASAQALAITVEPEAGSAAPTSTPMLVTPVTGL
jgi:anti-sigma-K factor RskA